jgi:predicted NAD-dependent protein-ADP-ribosyltransferase YbiA (DUF1768 family)
MRSRQALVPQPAQGKRERILIHPQRKDRYQSFDTYSPHLVTYNGKEYPTSEHLYQAFKVCVYFILFIAHTDVHWMQHKFMDNRPDIAEGVRTISKSPKKAFRHSMAHTAQQHPDWERMKVSKVRQLPCAKLPEPLTAPDGDRIVV